MKRSAFLLLLAPLWLCLPSRAADLYVATTGVDAGDCTDSLNPCLTIGYAVEAAAPSGDTIHVSSGWFEENIHLDRDLSIRGAGPSTVIGRSNWALSCPTGVTATLSELLLTGGTIGGVDNVGSLTLDHVVVSSNGGDVGGIFNRGTLTLIDCSVSDNRANIMGGGLLNEWGTATLINTTISDNDGGFTGGGIANQGVPGKLVLVNSTVSHNRVLEGGGGISNWNLGEVELYSSTVTGNRAGAVDGGGGIYNVSGSVTLQNTILAGNGAALGADCAGTLTSAGYNLIQDVSDCTLTGDLTGNIVGSDPGLAPLSRYGGPTETHALLTVSPAVDAGDPSGCRDHDGVTLVTDQRGSPRPVDCGETRCDMGAYEGCDVEPGPLVYESEDAALVAIFPNAVGVATSSPFGYVLTGGGALYYYQIDDGTGLPEVIKGVKGLVPCGVALCNGLYLHF